MKDNTNSEQIIFSKRAQEFLSTPHHTSPKTFNNPEEYRWIWDFTVGKEQKSNLVSDKILTLFYLNIKGSLLESLFLEAISRLITEKSISFLLKLTYREMENFLRDENHLPVFNNSMNYLAEESFKTVKNSLLTTFLITEIQENKGLSFQSLHWENLTLIEKNQKAQTIITLLNSLFLGSTPLQLALAEKETISIIINDFPVANDVLEELFKVIFHTTKENSSFKVIAVQ